MPGAGQPDAPETGARPEAGDRQRREFVSLMTSRVGDAFVRRPFYVDGAMDLVTLCRELSARGIGDALVRDGRRLGVFTTTNLRDALLRPERPGELAVREVATFAPVSVSVEDELFDAMILMLRHRVHRVVVRRGDEVVGVLSQLDLMGFVANHSHLIALQASQAADVGELKAAAEQINDLIRVLHADGVRVEVIAGLVGALNRRVFQRLWDLLAPEPLRANSCLFAMGSEGRGEQVIKTDQDNGLILRDGFVCGELEAVTEAFTAALIDFGYPPCPGGIMVSRPLWRQPLAGYRKSLREWILGDDPEGPMNLAIFLDAATVAGDDTLLEAARDHVNRLLSGSDAFHARFASAVQSFGQDGSWWSRLPGLRGREAAEIDLKKLGIFPIVHGVRALALQYRVRALGTVERLQALVTAGRVDEPLARDLVDALRFVIGLKLSNNLRQMTEGRTPDNRIRLVELGTLERQALKDSLRIVRRFKQWLGLHYRLDAL
jgi:CBS domain-containing protein